MTSAELRVNCAYGFLCLRVISNCIIILIFSLFLSPSERRGKRIESEKKAVSALSYSSLSLSLSLLVFVFPFYSHSRMPSLPLTLPNSLSKTLILAAKFLRLAATPASRRSKISRFGSRSVSCFPHFNFLLSICNFVFYCLYFFFR